MLSRKTSEGFTEHYDGNDDRKRIRDKILDILDRKTGNDIGKRVDGYVEIGIIEEKYNNISQIKRGYQRVLERLFG